MLTTTNAGLPVTFVSNTPEICTVVNGVQRAVSKGLCSVTVSASGNSKFLDYSSTFNSYITIQDVVRIIGFPTFYVNKYFDLTGSATSLSGAPLTYWTGKTSRSICYMRDATTLFAAGLGSCVIGVYASGNVDGYTNDPTLREGGGYVGPPPMEILSPNRITTTTSSATVANAVTASIVPGTYSRGATGFASVGQALNLTTSWIQCPAETVFTSQGIPASCSSLLSPPIWVPKASFSPGTSGYDNYSNGVIGLRSGNVPVAMGSGNGYINGQGTIYNFVVWNLPAG